MKQDVDKAKLCLRHADMLRKLSDAWEACDNKSFSSLKKTAIEHDFTCGRWMLFFPSEEIDDAWTRLTRALNDGKVRLRCTDMTWFERAFLLPLIDTDVRRLCSTAWSYDQSKPRIRALGWRWDSSCKQASFELSRSPPFPAVVMNTGVSSHQVVNVCIDPFDSFEEVQRSLITLRMECGVMGAARFKLDAFDHLKIAKDNEYDIPPSMYIASACTVDSPSAADQSMVVRTCVHIPTRNWCGVRKSVKEFAPTAKAAVSDSAPWNGQHRLKDSCNASVANMTHVGPASGRHPNDDASFWDVLPSDKLEVAVYFGHFEPGTSLNFFLSEAKYQGCKVVSSRLLPSSRGHKKVSGFVHVDCLEGAWKLVSSLKKLAEHKGKSVVVKIENVYKLDENGEKVKVPPSKQPVTSSSIANMSLPLVPTKALEGTSPAADSRPVTRDVIKRIVASIEAKFQTETDVTKDIPSTPKTSTTQTKHGWSKMSKEELPVPEFLTPEEFPDLVTASTLRKAQQMCVTSEVSRPVTPVVLEFKLADEASHVVLDDTDKDIVRLHDCGEYVNDEI